MPTQRNGRTSSREGQQPVAPKNDEGVEVSHDDIKHPEFNANLVSRPALVVEDPPHQREASYGIAEPRDLKGCYPLTVVSPKLGAPEILAAGEQVLEDCKAIKTAGDPDRMPLIDVADVDIDPRVGQEEAHYIQATANARAEQGRAPPCRP